MPLPPQGPPPLHPTAKARAEAFWTTAPTNVNEFVNALAAVIRTAYRDGWLAAHAQKD